MSRRKAVVVQFLALVFCGCNIENACKETGPCDACERYVKLYDSSKFEVRCECNSSGRIAHVEVLKKSSTGYGVVSSLRSLLGREGMVVLGCAIFWGVFYIIVRLLHDGTPG